MTRFQRFKHFISYYYKNSALLFGFSVVAIAVPISIMKWVDFSLWFWIVIAVNALNLAITIYQYIQYIRFNR